MDVLKVYIKYKINIIPSFTLDSVITVIPLYLHKIKGIMPLILFYNIFKFLEY